MSQPKNKTQDDARYAAIRHYWSTVNAASANTSEQVVTVDDCFGCDPQDDARDATGYDHSPLECHHCAKTRERDERRASSRR